MENKNICTRKQASLKNKREKCKVQPSKYTNTRQGQKDKKKYRRLQSGKGLASTIVDLGLTMGLKAINSLLGKKLIDKGIESLPDIVKLGA